jgi:DNA-binding transcriptional MerR regulator
MPPLPHQHPDGRYSVPGAAARFGVSRAVIRAWIKQELVTTSRSDFGTHRQVYWLDIDKLTAARLRARKATLKNNGRPNGAVAKRSRKP